MGGWMLILLIRDGGGTKHFQPLSVCVCGGGDFFTGQGNRPMFLILTQIVHLTELSLSTLFIQWSQVSECSFKIIQPIFQQDLELPLTISLSIALKYFNLLSGINPSQVFIMFVNVVFRVILLRFVHFDIQCVSKKLHPGCCVVLTIFL